MHNIMTWKEFEKIAKKLGWEVSQWFASFIANDYDLLSRPDGLESAEEILEKEKDFYYGKIKDIIEKLHLYIGADQSTHKNILQIIEIVKQLNIDYLMTKFKGKIDIQTAKELVNFAYTNGACGSIANLLCELFPESELTMIKAGNYSHQFVKIDSVCYDIFGESSEEEMSEFCAIQGKTSFDKCIEQPIGSLQPWRIHLLDFAVLHYIKSTQLLQRRDRALEK